MIHTDYVFYDPDSGYYVSRLQLDQNSDPWWSDEEDALSICKEEDAREFFEKLGSPIRLIRRSYETIDKK